MRNHQKAGASAASSQQSGSSAESGLRRKLRNLVRSGHKVATLQSDQNEKASLSTLTTNKINSNNSHGNVTASRKNVAQQQLINHDSKPFQHQNRASTSSAFSSASSASSNHDKNNNSKNRFNLRQTKKTPNISATELRRLQLYMWNESLAAKYREDQTDDNGRRIDGV